jgi:hypothetical protein
VILSIHTKYCKRVYFFILVDCGQVFFRQLIVGDPLSGAVAQMDPFVRIHLKTKPMGSNLTFGRKGLVGLQIPPHLTVTMIGEEVDYLHSHRLLDWPSSFVLPSIGLN